MTSINNVKSNYFGDLYVNSTITATFGVRNVQYFTELSARTAIFRLRLAQIPVASIREGSTILPAGAGTHPHLDIISFGTMDIHPTHRSRLSCRVSQSEDCGTHARSQRATFYEFFMSPR